MRRKWFCFGAQNIVENVHMKNWKFYANVKSIHFFYPQSRISKLKGDREVFIMEM